MGINLLNIQPHKVSNDLAGYITFIYGPPKIGKTTFGSQMPNALLLAFERGYNTIPGIMAQDVTSWSDMRQILRELKKPEVQEVYHSIIVDTIDLASEFCQKYICNQLDIENIGDGGWTKNGWDKYKKEFQDVFRTIAQLGYAVVFISHSKEKTIKPEQREEYQQICATAQSSALSIIENMSDIIGYAHSKILPTGESKVVLTLRSPDNSVACGSRFKYIPEEISFTYEALTEAIRQAIQKQAEETNNEFVTDEKIAPIQKAEYDYDALMAEFNDLVGKAMEQNQANAGKITVIIDKYLGKGKKVNETTPTQAEFIYLINNELKEDVLA